MDNNIIQFEEYGFHIIKDSDIEITDIIGDGSTSVVYRAIYKDSIVVVKRVEKSCIINNVYEYLILKNLEHEHIIKVIGILTDGSLVLPLYDGTVDDLYINKLLDEDIQKDIMMQITPALVYLRQNNIYHNDVIRNNIYYLYNDDKYKFVLADFGIATRDQPNTMILKINESKWNPEIDPIFLYDLNTQITEANLLKEYDQKQIDSYDFKILKGNRDIWIFIWDLFPSIGDFYDRESRLMSLKDRFINSLNRFLYTIDDSLLRDLIHRTLSFDFNNRITWYNILMHPFFM